MQKIRYLTVEEKLKNFKKLIKGHEKILKAMGKL